MLSAFEIKPEALPPSLPAIGGSLERANELFQEAETEIGLQQHPERSGVPIVEPWSAQSFQSIFETLTRARLLSQRAKSAAERLDERGALTPAERTLPDDQRKTLTENRRNQWIAASQAFLDRSHSELAKLSLFKASSVLKQVGSELQRGQDMNFEDIVTNLRETEVLSNQAYTFAEAIESAAARTPWLKQATAFAEASKKSWLTAAKFLTTEAATQLSRGKRVNANTFLSMAAGVVNKTRSEVAARTAAGESLPIDPELLNQAVEIEKAIHDLSQKSAVLTVPFEQFTVPEAMPKSFDKASELLRRSGVMLLDSKGLLAADGSIEKAWQSADKSRFAAEKVLKWVKDQPKDATHRTLEETAKKLANDAREMKRALEQASKTLISVNTAMSNAQSFVDMADSVLERTKGMIAKHLIAPDQAKRMRSGAMNALERANDILDEVVRNATRNLKEPQLSRILDRAYNLKSLLERTRTGRR